MYASGTVAVNIEYTWVTWTILGERDVGEYTGKPIPWNADFKPAWIDLDRVPTVRTGTDWLLLDFSATGFPWRCGYSGFAQQRTRGQPDQIDLVGIPISNATPIVTAVQLWPTRPIWPGLIANTLFWGTLCTLGVWGGRGAFRAVRRRRRRAKGWCIACGYDRRGIEAGVKCPECGG